MTALIPVQGPAMVPALELIHAMDSATVIVTATGWSAGKVMVAAMAYSHAVKPADSDAAISNIMPERYDMATQSEKGRGKANVYIVMYNDEYNMPHRREMVMVQDYKDAISELDTMQKNYEHVMSELENALDIIKRYRAAAINLSMPELNGIQV